MNNVQLVGRLVAVPELKITNVTHTNICSFTLACEYDNDRTKVDFIDCVAYRHCAKYICDYCQKGQYLVINGTLKKRNYVNKEGRKVYVTEVNVDTVNSMPYYPKQDEKVETTSNNEVYDKREYERPSNMFENEDSEGLDFY